MSVSYRLPAREIGDATRKGTKAVAVVIILASFLVAPAWLSWRIWHFMQAADGLVKTSGIVSEEVSPGGLHYARVWNASAEQVAIDVLWPNSEGALPGVGTATAHLAAAMMANEKGLSADVEGGTLQAQINVPRADLDGAVLLASQSLQRFDEDAARLDLAKAEAIKYAAGVSERGGALLFQTAAAAIAGYDGLRQMDWISDPAQVKAITLDEVKQWRRAVLQRQGAIIALAGDLDAAAAGQAVDTLFQGLPQTGIEAGEASVPNLRPRRILLHDPSAKTSKLAFYTRLDPSQLGADKILLNMIFNWDVTSQGQSLRLDTQFCSREERLADGRLLLEFSADLHEKTVAGTVAKIEEIYGGLRKSVDPSLAEEVRQLRTVRLLQAMDCPRCAAMAAAAKSHAGNVKLLTNAALYIDANTDERLAERLRTGFAGPDQFVVVAVSPDPNALPGACVITRPEHAVDCR